MRLRPKCVTFAATGTANNSLPRVLSNADTRKTLKNRPRPVHLLARGGARRFRQTMQGKKAELPNGPPKRRALMRVRGYVLRCASARQPRATPLGPPRLMQPPPQRQAAVLQHHVELCAPRLQIPGGSSEAPLYRVPDTFLPGPDSTTLLRLPSPRFYDALAGHLALVTSMAAALCARHMATSALGTGGGTVLITIKHNITDSCVT